MVLLIELIRDSDVISSQRLNKRNANGETALHLAAKRYAAAAAAAAAADDDDDDDDDDDKEM
jgi:hypothetical protein